MQSFVSFLKPLYVTTFLVLAIEMLQLMSGLNYYHYYPGHVEMTRLTGLVLLLTLATAAAMAAAAVATSRLLRPVGLEDRHLKGGMELICTVIFALVYIPAIIVATRKNFYYSMIFIWSWKNGLIPIAIAATIVLFRLMFKRGFTRIFRNIVDMMWPPLMVISPAVFVWLSVSFFTYDATAETRPPGPALASHVANEPNVILINFDAISARDLSLYGYHRTTTPFLEELAKESFVFESMHSNYNATRPAVVSIMTSQYPWTHGLTTAEGYLKKDEHKNIAALLPDHYTAAIVASVHTYPPLAGLGGQFDYVQLSRYKLPRYWLAAAPIVKRVVRKNVPPHTTPIIRHLSYLREGWPRDYYAETFDEAVKFLKGLEERPFFLWVQLWPAHTPYNPPPPFRGVFLPAEENLTDIFGEYEPSSQPYVDKMRARYDEYILFADAMLGRFLITLRQLELYDNSIIIISSDHGGMFEKGWAQHDSPYLWEPEVHIPLIIRLPGQGQAQARRISVFAEQVDIAPTILDLLGRPVPSWMAGESLVPYMTGESIETEKTKFSMAFASFYNLTGQVGPMGAYRPAKTIAAYRGDYKLIYDMFANALSLYNIREDPGELRNLAATRPAIVSALKLEIVKGYENSRKEN